jgi:hypothetical protein
MLRSGWTAVRWNGEQLPDDLGMIRSDRQMFPRNRETMRV